MNSSDSDQNTTTQLREQLAAYAHTTWSGWMYYLFMGSRSNPDGSVTIPTESVKRWKRLMETPYEDLTNHEKVSDQDEADNILGILRTNQETMNTIVHPRIQDRIRQLSRASGWALEYCVLYPRSAQTHDDGYYAVVIPFPDRIALVCYGDTLEELEDRLAALTPEQVDDAAHGELAEFD